MTSRVVTTFAELIGDGDLEIGDGYRARNDELGGNGAIFLRAGHVTDSRIDFEGVDRFHAELAPRLESKLSHPGDAIVTTKGNSTGRTAFVSSGMPSFVYSPHLSYWRSKNHNRIAPGFLRYWSRGPEFKSQLAGMMASTDMAPYLSLVDQRRLRITLPSIHDQRAIAHILGTLDDKIELNRRMNETLETMARALFKSWFVDFDPVRAKMEVRWSRGQSLPGLPAEMWDLFPERLVESELGKIPEGWEVGTLQDVADLNPENWTATTLPDRIRYVDLSNTKWGRIEPTVPLGARDAPSRARRILRPHDTIIGTVRPGNGAFAYIQEAGLTGSTGFAVLRPRTRAFAEFVFLKATSVASIEALAHLADGGAYPAVRPEIVAGIDTVLPPLDVAKRFSTTASALTLSWSRNDRESTLLSDLRDALLPRLITGDLRVDDAARAVARCALGTTG